MMVYAFECNIKGEDWHKVINAQSRGQAKSEYWRDVHESWESIPYTAVTCRKVGLAQTSSDFERVATYRGLPQARCGMRVNADGMVGTIIGHNSSANFDILFDGHRHPVNVHPHGIKLLDSGGTR